MFVTFLVLISGSHSHQYSQCFDLFLGSHFISTHSALINFQATIVTSQMLL